MDNVQSSPLLYEEGRVSTSWFNYMVLVIHLCRSWDIFNMNDEDKERCTKSKYKHHKRLPCTHNGGTGTTRSGTRSLQFPIPMATTTTSITTSSFLFSCKASEENHPSPRTISVIPSSEQTRRRQLFVNTAATSIVYLTAQILVPSTSFAIDGSPPLPETSTVPPKKPVLSGIANTKSWFRFFGSGFSIRVPPLFEDVMEPDDYNAGLSLYGDKVKPKKYAARFASPDGSEVVSVVIRPTNQLKITFLEAKDISDLGSLKTASKIFIPGGANLYSARTFKIKQDEDIRTYYYYEFGIAEQHVALVAAVNSGKAYIAGAAAPDSKWDEDGVKLRSAAISISF